MPTRRPLRILYLLSDGFGGHGGIATYNRDVLTALCADPDLTEVVALPRLVSRDMEPLPAKLRYEVSAALGMSAYLRALVAALRQGPFDLVYCAHVNLAPLARVAAWWSRAPWLLAIYGIDAWKPSSRRSVDRAVRHANHIFSISQVTLDRFLGWSAYDRARTSLMPNAIHLDQFGSGTRDPALERRYGLAKKRVLMTFGRMDASERYKGFDEVLDLLPALDPDIVYLLAGDGNDRARLEAKAVELGVADRAIFAGYIEESEKAATYRLADLYVMPSSGEGFGFVLIEALACGTPALGSRIDGGREALLGGELGILVDPTDRGALHDAIVHGLMQPRGVPPRLSYFAFPEFTRRLQALVHRVAERR
ncbi:MAG: glycosyltransferase family 4 protein [Sphingomonas sp.]|uniref:glycosyltransferase family 4 protein n=1 Tax=Sphingomonas sp. TaxID=28214 RepID=UPI001AC4C5E9|nr:glycosyltransferase family 4 protein [Sphingomonas sp.]MBN8806899.1 glycosyltransferase family 4 protein [Sphingomonas sp.]